MADRSTDRPATHLEISEWRNHQHYGKRRPPWIKVYAKLLTNAAFLALPEAAQAQLIKLWVLASQLGHPLPYNAKQLAGLIGTPGKLHLDALIAAGFLIPCYQNASAPLAKSDGNASTLVQSTENREQRTETTPPPPRAEVWRPAAEPRIAALLPTVAGKEALAAVLHVGQGQAGKVGICALIELMLAGERGEPRATPEQMDRALCDYVTNGMSGGGFAANHFRACVRNAIASEPSQSARARPTNVERSLAALKDIA